MNPPNALFLPISPCFNVLDSLSLLVHIPSLSLLRRTLVAVSSQTAWLLKNSAFRGSLRSSGREFSQSSFVCLVFPGLGWQHEPTTLARSSSGWDRLESLGAMSCACSSSCQNRDVLSSAAYSIWNDYRGKSFCVLGKSSYIESLDHSLAQ